jgi:hypothetical protein
VTMAYTLHIDVRGLIDEGAADICGRARPDDGRREEVDVHALLAGHQAIALVWDADTLVSRHPRLTRGQAWQVLKECERRHKAENGLSWDDVAEVVAELFPDPAGRLQERVSRVGVVLTRYDREGFGEADTLTNLLADARHWCDASGADFAELDGAARLLHLAELLGKGA